MTDKTARLFHDRTGRLRQSRQAVSRWESGDVTPTMDKLKALAKIYDVSLDWLCNEDESEEMVVGQKEADKEPKHNKKKSATMIVIAVLLAASIIVKAKLFCPEIAGLFCRIAGLFCHDSRANLSLKPVCFGIAIS